jgi:hypothetical protein
LFSQSLSATNSPFPAEGHVAFFAGKRPMVWMIFEKTVGIEVVRIGKFTLIVMDGPGVFGDVIALDMSA